MDVLFCVYGLILTYFEYIDWNKAEVIIFKVSQY